MSARSFRRAKARRALADESPTPPAPSSSSGILTHGLAALAISVLGLGVAGSVSLTSAAQSNQVDARSSLTADSPDVTRAEPAPRAAGLSKANQTAAQASEREAASSDDASDDGGTLDSFSGRDNRESRNSVRVELDKAIAAKEVAERQSELLKVDDKVVTTSRKAIQDDRAEELESTTEAIEAEDERIKAEEKKAAEKKAAEEKKKAEEERRKAEQATGTLVSESPTEDTGTAETTSDEPDHEFDAAQLGAGGGTSPISGGSYSIAARWGAVGSWSRYHTGMDLSAPIGTPIRAAADGVVVGPASGAGWAGIHVVVKHADGSHTLYAHMASTAVSPGQQVKAGTLVGVVGMTGRTFGPHLHFEWYPAGAAPGDVYSSKDPYVWMLAQGVRL
ncbi:M23 family metallopeptidase [Auraticoccus monumenti]|uniref:Murein DD-endopeptidase MepM and murein hydrolase activator NlpD, contain LysM domain n=1 Tax=Auraticoccus monumenti TaxID=675864 RepID=A0A1G6XMN5_9ACTN|nr:M23 family metallopeptidase [Auraticoccus monumenti]SDD79438.1 Murein DD-endopeptidase MepM and murein hydrolase activator NlpD, contain LysM domain [Auraticoccus monumenti]